MNFKCVYNCDNVTTSSFQEDVSRHRHVRTAWRTVESEEDYFRVTRQLPCVGQDASCAAWCWLPGFVTARSAQTFMIRSKHVFRIGTVWRNLSLPRPPAEWRAHLWMLHPTKCRSNKWLGQSNSLAQTTNRKADENGSLRGCCAV
jgi:hypothetical protein